MKITTVLFLFWLSVFSSFAQSQQWKLLSAKGQSVAKNELKFRGNLPIKYQTYSLDIEAFQKEVFDLRSKIIALPTSRGIQKFSYVENSSLSPALAAKFPMIKSYTANGIDDSSKRALISLGTNGVHIVIYRVGESPYYLDSYSKNNKIYIVYHKKDLLRDNSEFGCQVEDAVERQSSGDLAQRDSGDSML